MRVAAGEAGVGRPLVAATYWQHAARALALIPGGDPRQLEVTLGLARAWQAAGREQQAREAFEDAEILKRAYTRSSSQARREWAAPPRLPLPSETWTLDVDSSPPASLPQAHARPTAPAPRPAVEIRRDGELWVLVGRDGTTVRLKDAKGFAYLESLVRRPGEEIHVFELAGIDEPPGDAGPVLDARAKEEYRSRLEDLRGEVEEAQRFRDHVRASRAQQQVDALAEQLAAAVGLGGRDPRGGSQVEKARVNVQRRLKDAVERVSEAHPALGRYLAAAVRTGTYCSYTPR
jgi:non-specific serine/threonine protein kinase